MMRYCPALVVLGCGGLARPGGADEWRPSVTRALLEERFARFMPDYPALRTRRLERPKLLEERLFAMQAEGQPMFCSAQIMHEPAFWTDRAWPEASQTCCRIAQRLTRFDDRVPAIRAARAGLADAYPGCPAPPIESSWPVPGRDVD